MSLSNLLYGQNIGLAALDHGEHFTMFFRCHNPMGSLQVYSRSAWINSRIFSFRVHSLQVTCATRCNNLRSSSVSVPIFGSKFTRSPSNSIA